MRLWGLLLLPAFSGWLQLFLSPPFLLLSFLLSLPLSLSFLRTLYTEVGLSEDLKKLRLCPRRSKLKSVFCPPNFAADCTVTLCLSLQVLVISVRTPPSPAHHSGISCTLTQPITGFWPCSPLTAPSTKSRRASTDVLYEISLSAPEPCVLAPNKYLSPLYSAISGPPESPGWERSPLLRPSIVKRAA